MLLNFQDIIGAITSSEVMALVGLLNLTEDSMKLRADWKVFGVLTCLHTALALTVFGPTMIKLLMEVH